MKLEVHETWKQKRFIVKSRNENEYNLFSFTMVLLRWSSHFHAFWKWFHQRNYLRNSKTEIEISLTKD